MRRPVFRPAGVKSGPKNSRLSWTTLGSPEKASCRQCLRYEAVIEEVLLWFRKIVSELRQSRCVAAMLGVVKSEKCSGIEIDERWSAPWMVGGDGAQFFSRNRMPDEDRISDVQGVKNRDDIIAELPWVITRFGRGGLAKPTPRDKSSPSYVRHPRSAPAESSLVPLIQSTDRISRQRCRA